MQNPTLLRLLIQEQAVGVCCTLTLIAVFGPVGLQLAPCLAYPCESSTPRGQQESARAGGRLLPR